MKYLILFIFLYSQISFSEEKTCSCLEQKNAKSSEKKYRGNISLGMETIGEGTRSDPGILLKAYLSGGGLLKYSSSFALVSASNYLQGEFSLGGQFYPLNNFSESFISTDPSLIWDNCLSSAAISRQQKIIIIDIN